MLNLRTTEVGGGTVFPQAQPSPFSVPCALQPYSTHFDTVSIPPLPCSPAQLHALHIALGGCGRWHLCVASSWCGGAVYWMGQKICSVCTLVETSSEA
jgi:hypothetical protein